MRKSQGFTLVELLVVIGIIALLISILLPALNKARAQAQVVACTSMLRQVALATRAYAAENRDALPPLPMDNGDVAYNINASTPAATAQATPFARSVTWPYWTNQGGTDPEILDPTIGAGIGRLNRAGQLKGKFEQMVQCPNGYNGGRNYFNNYGYNFHPQLKGPGYNGTSVPSGSTFRPWWKKASEYGRVPKTPTDAYNAAGGALVKNFQFAHNKYWALAIDPLFSPSTGPSIGYQGHLVKNQYAVNLALIDGSAHTALIPKSVVRNQVDSMGRYLDIANYAEAVANDAGTGSSWVTGAAASWSNVPISAR